MLTLETPSQVATRIADTNRHAHMDALRREALADAAANAAIANLFHKCADDLVKAAANEQWNAAWDKFNQSKGIK